MKYLFYFDTGSVILLVITLKRAVIK